MAGAYVSDCKQLRKLPLDVFSLEVRSAVSKMTEVQKANFVSTFNDEVALGTANQVESWVRLTGNRSELNGKELRLTSEEGKGMKLLTALGWVFAVAVMITYASASDDPDTAEFREAVYGKFQENIGMD